MKIYIASSAPTDKVLFITKPTTMKDLFPDVNKKRYFLNGQHDDTTPLKDGDFILAIPPALSGHDNFFIPLKNVLNKPKNPSQYPYILIHHGTKPISVPKGFTALDFLTTMLPTEHQPSDIFVNGIKVLDEENFKFKHDDRIALEAIPCQ